MTLPQQHDDANVSKSKDEQGDDSNPNDNTATCTKLLPLFIQTSFGTRLAGTASARPWLSGPTCPPLASNTRSLIAPSVSSTALAGARADNVSQSPTAPSGPAWDTGEVRTAFGSNSSINSCVAFQVQLDRNNELAPDEKRKLLLAQASQNSIVNGHISSVGKVDDLLNVHDMRIKEDIIRMITQYLSDEGYHASTMTLQDETNVRLHEHYEYQYELRRLRKAILDGDWTEVEKLISATSGVATGLGMATGTYGSNGFRSSRVLSAGSKTYKAFLYAFYKQQFLELIEHHETQKAFNLLLKRLKPLEAYQTTADEFRDSSYLLTAKSVHDAPSFRNWEGIGPGRERLVEQLQSMLDSESLERRDVYVPPGRLLTLIRQALAYQVESARYHPKVTPRISTLLDDYTAFVIPNAVHRKFVGHSANVKCADYVGTSGQFIASGSSDNTVRIWNTETSATCAVLRGHTSRVWDLHSTRSGNLLASVSGDSTVRLWNLDSVTSSYRCDMKAQSLDTDSSQGANVQLDCVSTFRNSTGDIYTVQFHPFDAHLATGGHDKLVRIYDADTGQVIKTFSGHTQSICKAVFSPMGNLIVSGSKDGTIRFWDVISGLCVRTITSHLGEVTSVELSNSGTLLLSSSKDNSNRLWDMRMLRSLQKYKGHTNTAKNFIRASFAGVSSAQQQVASNAKSSTRTTSDSALVVGGSEDGFGYIWDRETGALLQRLRGHEGIVYDVRWSARQSLFITCSDDATVRSWYFDEAFPISDDDA